MKKNILLCMSAFILIEASILFAQENEENKPVIVITTFDAKGIATDDIEFVMNMFTTAFSNLGVARIVDRGSFDKIRGELSFQASDWSDSKKVAELGKALNANQVVVGQLMKRGVNLFLTVKILDVNTTTIVSSHLDRVTSIDDFFEKMPEFCSQLVAKASEHSLFSTATMLGNYKVGDDGPGGGIVFYVDKKGFTVYDGKGGKKTCYYLEMGKDEMRLSYWYPQNFIVNTREGLGYGKSNTYKILNRSSEKLTEDNCAAYRCSKYTTPNTKAGEWFLPSKDELDLMYKTQGGRVLATCRDSWHWSSSEDVNSYVWVQCFSSGMQQIARDNKYTYRSVRPVRAF